MTGALARVTVLLFFAAYLACGTLASSYLSRRRRDVALERERETDFRFVGRMASSLAKLLSTLL